MTTTATVSPAQRRAAVYLAVVQFFFVTTWTIYVVYLPGLLAQAGLPAHYAGWILILDQLLFMAADIAAGVAADRAGRAVGRIGPLVIGVTLVSAAAFLALPHAALLGSAAPAAMLALIVVWAATSSVLRAPPFVLISRHAAAPVVPWLNALMLSGLALGGAVAPYLGVTLKNVDPRIPFALSAATLAATVLGLAWVERRLAAVPAPSGQAMPAPRAVVAGAVPFLMACLLLAGGFQIHFSLNSAPQYLRHAQPADLELLMPVFWIGFNVAMFPGASLARRYGVLPVMACAALAGAAGTYAAAHATALDVLIAAQLVAGGAWGCALMAAFSAMAGFGRAGREGLALGLLFAVLAVAALSRIAVTASGAGKLPEVSNLLSGLPPVMWFAGGILLAWLSLRGGPRAPPGAAVT